MIFLKTRISKTIEFLIDSKMENEIPKRPAPFLTEVEQATYQWQIWTDDFGEEGQRRLKKYRFKKRPHPAKS